MKSYIAWQNNAKSEMCIAELPATAINLIFIFNGGEH